MKKLLTLITLITLGVVVYAQEPARFERGINLIRGDLTISQGTLVLGSNASLDFLDDALLQLGTDNDQVLLNRSATLAANTAVTNVLIGTPVTRALAANSLMVSNVTASGDIGFYANRGGNSEEYLLADSSAGQLRLTSPATHLLLNTVAIGTAVRINVRTSTVDSSGDFIGFRAAPRIGVASTGSVFGGQVSGQVGAFALDGAAVGLQADVFLNGATGTVGHVRGLQLELVTSDAATRTVTNDVAGIRMRAAWSGTITGDFVPFLIEKAEAQTNSNQFTHVAKLTSTTDCVWHDTDTASGDTEAGYLAVEVNGNKRYLLLYSDAPTGC